MHRYIFGCRLHTGAKPPAAAVDTVVRREHHLIFSREGHSEAVIVAPYIAKTAYDGQLVFRLVKPAENNKKGGLKSVVTVKPGFGAIKNRVKKVLIKSNERVTQGGLIKRKKTRQTSAKKKALAR